MLWKLAFLTQQLLSTYNRTSDFFLIYLQENAFVLLNELLVSISYQMIYLPNPSCTVETVLFLFHIESTSSKSSKSQTVFGGSFPGTAEPSK